MDKGGRPSRCQETFCAQAVFSTHFPIGTMSPVSSAERNELDGRHDTEIGMLPAYQRLDAGDPLRVEIEASPGSAGKNSLRSRPRPQARFQRHPFEGVDIDLLRVELVVVLPSSLARYMAMSAFFIRGLLVCASDTDTCRRRCSPSPAFLPLNRT